MSRYYISRIDGQDFYTPGGADQPRPATLELTCEPVDRYSGDTTVYLEVKGVRAEDYHVGQIVEIESSFKSTVPEGV